VLEKQNKDLTERKEKAESDLQESLKDLTNKKDEITAKEALIKKIQEENAQSAQSQGSSEELDKAKEEVARLNAELAASEKNVRELNAFANQVIEELEKTNQSMTELR
jgi:predicted nuclease with TOPRIM domain